MKIAVIAANGRSGREFVQAALDKGHTLRAGIHSKNNLPSHPNLLILPASANDPAQIQTLISGCDAVVSFIGHTKGSSKDVQTVAITNVIAAMKAENIRRIVSLTGTGVRMKFDKITMVDRLLNGMLKIMAPALIADGINHVEVLKQSDLDWTVVRALILQNGKPFLFQLTPNGPPKTFVRRSEVAQAVLQVLELKTYIKATPVISSASKK